MLRFKTRRDLEQPAVLKRAAHLIKFLEREATTLYRMAETLDRTGALESDLLEFSIGALMVRAAERGLLQDALGELMIRVGLADELSKQIEKSSTELRQCAASVIRAAESAQGIVDGYVEMAKRLRRASIGRYPSVALHGLVEETNVWGMTIPEIARRLVEDGCDPPQGKSDEPDPQIQWEVILKQARKRFRARGTK